MAEIITSILFSIAEYSITALIVGYVISLIIILVSTIMKSGTTKITLRIIALALFLYSNFNVFVGHTIAGNLINKFGETGNAVTVKIRQTNNQYNDYWIMEHSMVLETKEGSKYETTFEDSDFNIYPKPKQGYVYPHTGEKYSIKYLRSNPKAFVIISNDGSQYSKRIQCENLIETLNEALQKYKFDSLNSSYKDKYLKAREDYDNFGCSDLYK